MQKGLFGLEAAMFDVPTNYEESRGKYSSDGKRQF